MLKSETFFGKRETQTPNAPLSGINNVPSGSNPVSVVSKSSPLSTLNHMHTSSSTASTNDTGSKLIVGPNIKLKGVEITDCDILVVEGRVEATIHSRVIHIAEKGAFIGSAEVDLAEIYGEFDGDLIVCEKLVIYATGKVSGKIRYGKVVVEEGGQLIGTVETVGSSIHSANKTTTAPVV